MLRFYAERFHAATNAICELRCLISKLPEDGAILAPDITQIETYLADLRSLLTEMDLGVSVQNVEYLHNRLIQNPQVDADLRAALRHAFRILNDELRTHLFLHVERRDKPLYDAVALFGVEVRDKFLSATYDIEETGKCLALGRSTASAFHSIRCLEAAIRGIARCLGIPDPTRASDRNWGAVLGTVRDELARRWPGSSNRMSGDGEFFDNAYTALAAMQNPWRNATMHLDQKYTPDEARTIFETVKGFMQRIASRMDENGDPKV
jgi:hypothetical protein